MDLTASAMLPFDDADQARSALRARLLTIVEQRRIPEAALATAKMLVAGPTVVTDATGRRWFEWVATLKIRPVPPRRYTGDLTPDEDTRRPTVDDLGLLRRRAG